MVCQFNDVKRLFAEIHSNDEEHLNAIFSNSNKLIIEAPAGSGKTKILISKIAYNVLTNKIPLNKKILALTFSVNAAYKIKKEIVKNLPKLIEGHNYNPSSLNNIVNITNFHGFARKVLKKYGRLLDNRLENIDLFESISDSREEDLKNQKIELCQKDIQWIVEFNNNIVNNKINYQKDRAAFLKYISYVKNYYLPQNKISHNSHLIYLLLLFEQFPAIKDFYQKLYPIIIVDEFQDTNSIAWEIITTLTTNSTKLWLFGDSLQRIYGFIGAIEGLIERAKNELDMDIIELHTNYRFKDNRDLLNLDRCIRENAKNFVSPQPSQNANIVVYKFDTIEQENIQTINVLEKFLQESTGEKIAILIKQRSPDIQKLIESMENAKIKFFYAIFSDDDKDYVNFHTEALEKFINLLREKKPRNINKSFLDVYCNLMKQHFEFGNQTEKSLIVLLEAFIKNIQTEYRFLDRDDKISYIVDMLSNRSLKQCMEYVDSYIILSTVHGAKGLEWDNIIVRGMKEYTFPSYTLCYNCRNTLDESKCFINLQKLLKDKEIAKIYLEELSVFYVAATRAKKKLIFTTNKERINRKGDIYNCHLSCFLQLPGIRLNMNTWFDKI